MFAPVCQQHGNMVPHPLNSWINRTHVSCQQCKNAKKPYINTLFILCHMFYTNDIRNNIFTNEFDIKHVFETKLNNIHTYTHIDKFSF